MAAAQPDRRRLLQQALALAALAAAPLRTGAAVQDGAWTDEQRRRSLPWRLRLPAVAGPWPLVIYSHGLGGSREGGDVWGKAWAEAGLAVLHLQHPGSDIDVLRGGPAALREAVRPAQRVARTRDVAFVIDEVARRAREGDRLWASLRPDALGLAGHSYGAQTTQAVAGQRFPAPGSLADARPLAFVALSPSSSRVKLPLQRQFGAIERPFLCVTGSDDGDPFGSFADGQSRAAVYEGLPAGQRALLWLDGADHMTFAGNGERRIDGRGLLRRTAVAREREPAQHALVARVMASWWRWRLLGDDAARAALAQPEGLGPQDRLQLG